MEQQEAPTSQPAPDTRPPEEQPQEESGQGEPGHFDPETGNLTPEPLDDDFNDRADGQTDGEAANNA